MPLNRTNIDVQARTPGMVLTTGKFLTDIQGDVLSNDSDVGVVVQRTATGTYTVALPAIGQLNTRDAHAASSNVNAYLNRIISPDGKTLTIETRDAAPSTGGGGGSTFIEHTVRFPIDAVVTTLPRTLMYAFPTDGTLMRVTYAPDNTTVTPAPGTGFVLSITRHNKGAGESPLAINLALAAGPPGFGTYNNIAQWDAEPFYFAAGEGAGVYDFNQFDTVLIEGSQIDQAAVPLPSGQVTATWRESVVIGGGGLGGLGTLTDFPDTEINYTIWVKNSSAR